ncbi:uncharacterized protein [Ptychodera flava]|uniref:uncharacterized protein n=1 Tax=Ptychodera flava TaxID=63121 RepID=UPI003969F0ED
MSSFFYSTENVDYFYMLIVLLKFITDALAFPTTLRLFDFMNMSCIGKSTFFRHQHYYLQLTIIKVWKDEQATMINQLSNIDGGLILAGDGRSGSPGHCAKYGSYSVIEQRLNKVLDIQLVQSNEVPNSAWCEHEGLKRTIAFLIESGLEVSTIISDRHRQNAKWIKDELPDTKHYYDVWYVAKGIGKKMIHLVAKKIAQTSSMETVHCQPPLLVCCFYSR